MFKFFLYTCMAWAVLSFCANANAQVSTLTYLDFEQGVLPSGGGWSFGYQDGGLLDVSTDSSKNFAASGGSLRAVYPVALGNIYASARYDLSALKTRDVYIEFMAKMPLGAQGLKFVKIFGETQTTAQGNNYANTTFGLDYTSTPRGNMCSVSYGDGSGEQNDTASRVTFDGIEVYGGRAFTSQSNSIILPEKRCFGVGDWGSKWHHFKYHVKFNSGTTADTEVADGELYAEIDGRVYVDVKKLFNRHYTNKPISAISFFDWAQNGTAPFEVWLDNIRITTGGFLSPSPKPPKVN